MIEYEFDEEIENCIICGNSDIYHNLTDFRGISISKCNKCGFQFMNPQYSDKYLSEYYSKYIKAEDFDYWHEALLYGHDYYFSLIEKHVLPGKMLDIGCGNGYLLEAAMRRGWSVHGYDVDKNSTQRVSARLGIYVGNGDFYSNKFDGGYNLITMHQVLEHLKDPNKLLEKIHYLLDDEGYLFVAVPNIKSLSNKIKYYMEKKGIRKKHIGKYYDTSHHILYFDPDSLVAILKKHGFNVIYKRNCHSVRPGQTKLKRFIMRNITDHLFAKSTFMVIAKKI